MKKSVLKQLIEERVFDEAVSKHGTLINNPIEIVSGEYVVTFLNETITITLDEGYGDFKEAHVWDWVKLTYTQLIDKLSKKQFKPLR